MLNYDEISALEEAEKIINQSISNFKNQKRVNGVGFVILGEIQLLANKIKEGIKNIKKGLKKLKYYRQAKEISKFELQHIVKIAENLNRINPKNKRKIKTKLSDFL